MGWEASPLETESVKQGIVAFQEQYPYIKVDYTPGLAGAEYSAKLLTMFAGNAAPDVFFCGDSDYRTFASKGVLFDITDKFDATFPVDDFIDSSKTIMNINGKYYGISSCTVSPILYYNKAIFDKAGIAYPSSDPDEAMTWEEYRALSLQLTIKNGDKTEQYGTYGLESWLMTPMLYSNNASLFDKDFTKTTVNSPEAAEVFDAIRDLRIVDGSAPDATTLENIGMSAAQIRDLPQPQALQQQESDLLLGRRQAPSIQLRVDRARQPFDMTSRLLPPGLGLRTHPAEVFRLPDQTAAQAQRAAQQVHGAQQGQPGRQDFQRHVPGGSALPQVAHDIHHHQQRDQQQDARDDATFAALQGTTLNRGGHPRPAPRAHALHVRPAHRRPHSVPRTPRPPRGTSASGRRA